MDRHHREELINGPGVWGRAKDRKVGVVGACQGCLQIAKVLGHPCGGQLAGNGPAAGPIQLFGATAVPKAQVTKPKGRMGIVFEFARVIPGLLQVFGADARKGVAQVAHDQRLPL